jgi:hypothetical protein
MRTAALAVAAASCLSFTAQAEDERGQGWHVGIGGGRSSYDIEALDVDEDATAWKAFVGYRLNENLALELAYIDTGEAEHDFGGGVEASIDAQIVQASLVGSYWLGDSWAAYARLGANYYDATAEATDGTTRIKLEDDGTEFGWGAGLQAIGAGALWRLEYESVEFEEVDGTLISLSVTWRL